MMQTALQVIYPARCLSCDGLVDGGVGLCGRCWRDTPFISGTICDKCGTSLPGEVEGEGALCDDCMRIARPWRKGRAALEYRDNARKLVLALKHGDRHDIAKPAARWMANSLRGVKTRNLLILPVPLHPRRLLSRRYNQSALLAQRLSQELCCDWAPSALRRIKATKSLDGLSRDARFEALEGVIAPARNAQGLLAGRSVLIVDDVMTSGATLAATTEATYASGAMDVCICALARVVKDT